MNGKNTNLLWTFMTYDIVIIVISFLGSVYLKFNSFRPGEYVIILPVIVAIWIVTSLAFSSTGYHFRDGLYRHFRRQVIDFLIFIGIVSTLVLVLDLKLYSRLVLFGTILFFFVLRNIGFMALYRYLAWMRSKGRHVKRLLVVGTGRMAKEVLNEVKRDITLGYRVVGFLDCDLKDAIVPKDLILGVFQDFDSVAQAERVEEIIIAIPLTETETIVSAIQKAEFHGLRMSMVPDYYRLMARPFETHDLGQLPLVGIRGIALDSVANKALKRTFDVAFSTLALIVTLPLMIIISVLIKLESKGPVFYRPKRVGLNGVEFDCLKFRSMIVDNSPEHTQKSTVKGDPRITQIGAFIRRSSLDELPQFINVLFGEMSVVGPRPHRKFLNDELQSKVEGYMLRHYIKPGITGWAQVNGWRGPTETMEQKTNRTKHDLWYIDNWTFWLDVRIILMTVFGKAKENAF